MARCGKGVGGVCAGLVSTVARGGGQTENSPPHEYSEPSLYFSQKKGGISDPGAEPGFTGPPGLSRDMTVNLAYRPRCGFNLKHL